MNSDAVAERSSEELPASRAAAGIRRHCEPFTRRTSRSSCAGWEHRFW